MLSSQFDHPEDVALFVCEQMTVSGQARAYARLAACWVEGLDDLVLVDRAAGVLDALSEPALGGLARRLSAPQDDLVMFRAAVLSVLAGVRAQAQRVMLRILAAALLHDRARAGEAQALIVNIVEPLDDERGRGLADELKALWAADRYMCVN